MVKSLETTDLLSDSRYIPGTAISTVSRRTEEFHNFAKAYTKHPYSYINPTEKDFSKTTDIMV